METVIENNQVAIIENSLDVLKTGPEILMANQNRKEKALAVGRNILATIVEEGMSQEADERANKYLANVSAANKSMKESRAGVTQIMDQLKKMFTEVENDLDVKKPGTIPSQIQAHRDQYAKEVAAEQERKRKQAELEAAKAKEAIDIKYQMEANYKEQFGQYLLLRKTKMQNGFNAITLERFEELSGKLKELSFPFPFQFNYENRFISTGVKYHSAEELKAFSDAVIIENESELEGSFIAEMNLLKDDLVDKLPSKLAELQEQKRLDDEAKAEAEAARIAEEKRQAAIAKAKEEARIAEEKRQAEIAQASAKEKKRLEAEAEIARKKSEEEKKRLEAAAEIERQKEKERQEEMRKKQEAALAIQKLREQEESEKMKAEAEEQKRKSDLEAEVKKQGEQTMVLFEQEAAMAEVSQAPEARQGYEIKILHQVGYTQIFALWFESEGKNLPMDKIGRTSCDQMKAWAEKHAHKTGTKIDSKFLKYEESYKAVNRKAK